MIIALSITVISLTRFTVSASPRAGGGDCPHNIRCLLRPRGGRRHIRIDLRAFSLPCKSKSETYSALGFAFGGLMSGIFGRLSKISCCVAFGDGKRNYISAGHYRHRFPYRSLRGSYRKRAVFRDPKSLYSEFLKFIKPSAEIQNKSGAEESAVMRLKFASEALEEVSETVNTVADKLSAITAPSFEQVFDKPKAAAVKAADFGCIAGKKVAAAHLKFSFRR